MKFITENADANKTVILNQAIALIMSFKATNGSLYLKNGGREELNFIYKSKNEEEKDGEKAEAIDEWLGYLQHLLLQEGIETLLYRRDDDATVLSFLTAEARAEARAEATAEATAEAKNNKGKKKREKK